MKHLLALLLAAVPVWAAAATGAVAGLVAGAMLYRVAVGLAAGTALFTG